MQTKLSHIINAIDIQNKTAQNRDFDPNICGLAYDSRNVKSGFLFFALPGVHVNGNEFIVQAVKNGAAAILYQDELSEKTINDVFAVNEHAVLLQTTNTRFCMAPVSSAFYNFPSEHLIVIGVTGTEGKSTTVSLIWQLLRLMGHKAGFISTVEYSLGGDALENPEHQTTPEAPIIQEKLFAMMQQSCEFAIIESSSHGLSEKTNRLGHVSFDAAAFMNVTHEHLEFHGTHEQYKSDKANLFRKLDENSHNKKLFSGEKTIIPIGAVNLDDISAEYFAQSTKHDVVGFTVRNDAKIPHKIKKFLCAQQIESDKDGVTFTLQEFTHNAGEKKKIDEFTVRIELPGAFNVYNTMASLIICSRLLNQHIKETVKIVQKLKPVKGRMSAVNCGQPFEVIVDYAHTPSSFETVFPPLKKRAKGRIISLFGSGGERDVQKRPIQGEIAARYSDIVILTDEDPRGEDPMELLEMIAQGCVNLPREEKLFLIPSRPKAIRKAFSLAKKDDIVLLLGKGHENSIIFKTHTMPYDEISEAKKALGELGFKE